MTAYTDYRRHGQSDRRWTTPIPNLSDIDGIDEIEHNDKRYCTFSAYGVVVWLRYGMYGIDVFLPEDVGDERQYVYISNGSSADILEALNQLCYDNRRLAADDWLTEALPESNYQSSLIQAEYGLSGE